MTKSYNIALVGILSAINVASRVLFQFLPNMKPVTSIIILTTISLGLYIAMQVVITTTLLSSILLGIGPYVIFQILAWLVIVLVTYAIKRFLKPQKITLYVIWAGISGFLFGFVVSLEKIFYGWTYFITYYIAGIPFDALHALGNILFFPICYLALNPIFKKVASKL